MEQEIQKKLNEHSEKLDAIYKSVEKTRKYFLAVIWITVAAVVLPLVGLVFAVPAFLSAYSGALNGL